MATSAQGLLTEIPFPPPTAGPTMASVGHRHKNRNTVSRPLAQGGGWGRPGLAQVAELGVKGRLACSPRLGSQNSQDAIGKTGSLGGGGKVGPCLCL